MNLTRYNGAMNEVAERLRIAARMAHIEPFEVMEIQTLAREVEARGRDVIHLEIGEPDFRTPRPVVRGREAGAGLRADVLHLGPRPARSCARRSRASTRSATGVEVPASRVIVTAGSSAALLLAFGVLLDPGDEVLLADPGYPCNRHFVRALGARAARRCRWARPPATSSPPSSRGATGARRTRMAMVASPSNPTGTLVTPEEIARLAALAREKRAARSSSTRSTTASPTGATRARAAEAGDDVFVINSFSKYFQMTGWRLGWMLAPPQLVREVEMLAQNLFISPSTVAQHAALACFAPGDDRDPRGAPRASWTRAAASSCRPWSPSGFAVPVMPQGAFYVYADCSRADAATASRSRASCSRRRAWRSRRARTSARNEPERHVRIAYTQPVARLEEAVGAHPPVPAKRRA